MYILGERWRSEGLESLAKLRMGMDSKQQKGGEGFYHRGSERTQMTYQPFEACFLVDRRGFISFFAFQKNQLSEKSEAFILFWGDYADEAFIINVLIISIFGWFT